MNPARVFLFSHATRFRKIPRRNFLDAAIRFRRPTRHGGVDFLRGIASRNAIPPARCELCASQDTRVLQDASSKEKDRDVGFFSGLADAVFIVVRAIVITSVLTGVTIVYLVTRVGRQDLFPKALAKGTTAPFESRHWDCIVQSSGLLFVFAILPVMCHASHGTSLSPPSPSNLCGS